MAGAGPGRWSELHPVDCGRRSTVGSAARVSLASGGRAVGANAAGRPGPGRYCATAHRDADQRKQHGGSAWITVRHVRGLLVMRRSSVRFRQAARGPGERVVGSTPTVTHPLRRSGTYLSSQNQGSPGVPLADVASRANDGRRRASHTRHGDLFAHPGGPVRVLSGNSDGSHEQPVCGSARTRPVAFRDRRITAEGGVRSRRSAAAGVLAQQRAEESFLAEAERAAAQAAADAAVEAAAEAEAAQAADEDCIGYGCSPEQDAELNEAEQAANDD